MPMSSGWLGRWHVSTIAGQISVRHMPSACVCHPILILFCATPTPLPLMTHTNQYPCCHTITADMTLRAHQTHTCCGRPEWLVQAVHTTICTYIYVVIYYNLISGMAAGHINSTRSCSLLYLVCPVSGHSALTRGDTYMPATVLNDCQTKLSEPSFSGLRFQGGKTPTHALQVCQARARRI